MVQCCCSLDRYAYNRIFEQIGNFSDFGLWKLNVVQIFFVILASFFVVDFV